jgi:phosphatidylserine decarboxylase
MLITMATLEQPPFASLTPTTPSGVQPGGVGLCVHLELAWGRLRRGWLRRFRPDYVRQREARRQGECRDCPHDIIDDRDLKFCRNVCGYFFGPDEDPYRRRGLLPLARAGMAEVVCSSVVLLSLAMLFGILATWSHLAWTLPLAAVLGTWLFVISFFRDPERVIPTDPLALLSPADGTIIGVGEVAEPDFPGGRAFRVSIFLSPFNVHINRIPRSGRVVALRYFRGRFIAATRGDCDRVNEQFWTDIEEPCGRLVRIKQVAGAVARRIVCWLRPQEQVSAGDRYGMIKLGSRTDVLIPMGEPIEVLVRAGDKVQGGATVLLRFRAAPPEAQAGSALP